MKLYGVYGASGFGREVMPLLRSQVLQDKDTSCVFVDDSGARESVNGHECLTFEAFCAAPADERALTIAIGDSAIREQLLLKCQAACIAIIDVKAGNSIVMDDAKISEGLVLCAFTTITSNVSIGRQFHANMYSYVAHDCVIGDFVTFAPGAKVNGNVTIGDHAYLGSGAVIRQGLTIGQGATVGMGAVVTRDVPPGITVVGNPAKPLNKS